MRYSLRIPTTYTPRYVSNDIFDSMISDIKNFENLEEDLEEKEF